MRQGVLEQYKEAKRLKNSARMEHLQKKMNEIQSRLYAIQAEERKVLALYREYANSHDPRVYAAQDYAYELHEQYLKYSRMLYG